MKIYRKTIRNRKTTRKYKKRVAVRKSQKAGSVLRPPITNYSLKLSNETIRNILRSRSETRQNRNPMVRLNTIQTNVGQNIPTPRSPFVPRYSRRKQIPGRPVKPTNPNREINNNIVPIPLFLPLEKTHNNKPLITHQKKDIDDLLKFAETI